MDDRLTADEYEALQQISTARREKPSACVARNAKRLTGLKYSAYSKDGQLGLTEKGKLTLFIKQCIDGLRAVSADQQAVLTQDVITFLSKKGHIVPAEGGGFSVTLRGSETLADIDANQKK